ncbi:hypothetical protein MJI47_27065, partial [Salmonella enterica subsp. enterica serovar Kentucky]|nr:hypothetical protein [Salmonella enterica subsp. enterica serovar Kentucky]
IDDTGFGADLAAVQDDYISRSRLLDARLWVKRPLWQRITERLGIMTTTSAFMLNVRLDNVAVVAIDVPGEKVNTLKAEFAAQVR